MLQPHLTFRPPWPEVLAYAGAGFPAPVRIGYRKRRFQPQSAANLARIRAVAASLRPSEDVGAESDRRKQETPRAGTREVSTAHRLLQQESEGRCAHVDTIR